MKSYYLFNEIDSIEEGQRCCYLLTNGLGGFAAGSMIGSTDRNDHALLMAALVSPNMRYHLVSNVMETITCGQEVHSLYSQQYLNGDEILEHKGYQYLKECQVETLPTWYYEVPGAKIEKTIVMPQGENTIGIKYKITKETEAPVALEVTPLFQFLLKGHLLERGQEFTMGQNYVESNSIKLYFEHNGLVYNYDTQYTEDLFYEKDKRDGRDFMGRCAHNFKVVFHANKEVEEFYLILSTKEEEHSIDKMIQDQMALGALLRERSGLRDEYGQTLAESAFQYICDKASTNGKTILAGFPFFGDWGRDTMIALPGCAIATKCFEEAKDILRSFMRCCDKGLMPNLFPEGTDDALYNTVDAALLFVQAVYEYYQKTGDTEFVKEAMPVIEEIITWYRKGTDYHIAMDEDGLIMAGADLEQVTWMDVRYGDILPTPRHGKPVEINAYWYNALCVADEFRESILKEEPKYGELKALVKKNFLEKFWSEEKGYLRDVVSMNNDNVEALKQYRKAEGRWEEGEEIDPLEVDWQIRPNQVWALSMPYSMLNEEQAERILQTIEERLLTKLGLRSLSDMDKDFHPDYVGGQDTRDMAYHQGTVWPYPMGAYYLAKLRWSKDKKKAIQLVKERLTNLKWYIMDGCAGHIAEVYDGLKPEVSKGCFAQAWSVGELLRVYVYLEELEKEYFFEEYCYEGNDLGATYSKDQTTFKVWAPMADEVVVNIYRTGDVEDTLVLQRDVMLEKEAGIFETTLEGDYANLYYTYEIHRGNQVEETADIYANACGINGLRSMVVDLESTDPAGWKNDHRVLKNHTFGTIYELHIKDFSYDENSGVTEKNKGKYLAFTEEDSFAVNYLKDLGVDYVHLLPFHDYGSVEEESDDFNWGYDPINYRIPEGSYSTNPRDGGVRIREVKRMVQALHEAGIGVVMDVVFNHTYHLDSYFQKTVPGYYYRQDENGEYTNGSGCGNDTKSERKMYRKYMVDALVHWAKEYHFDGFRFDLMGLHDVETMNEIRKALDELEDGKNIILYGEPWSAGYSAFDEGAIPAVKKNIHLLDERIGIFCDNTRDLIKGSVFWDKEPGYVNTSDEEQQKNLVSGIKNSVKAWCDVEEFGTCYVRNNPGEYDEMEPFCPKTPAQIISYVSAHDNYTLWDKLRISTSQEVDFNKEAEGEELARLVQMNKMVAGIVFTTLGRPFIHAGEEFGRTKWGEDNSYKSSPDLNKLDYKRAKEMEDLVSYYKGLIAFRKTKESFGVKMEEAPKKITFLPVEAPFVAFTFEDTVVIYNPTWEEWDVVLPEGDWKLVSDGITFMTGEKILSGKVCTKAKSVTILEK